MKRIKPFRDIPNTCEIISYVHCMACLKEMPRKTSPEQFALLNIGFTNLGIQVWCRRHNLNIMHVDFQGITHPANFNVAANKKSDDEVTNGSSAKAP